MSDADHKDMTPFFEAFESNELANLAALIKRGESLTYAQQKRYNELKAQFAAPAAQFEVTAGQLAAVMGLHVRRIQQLVKEGIVKRKRHGKYDLGESCRAYIEFIEDRDIGQSRKRLIDAQADMAEIELSKMRQEVIPAADVARDWGAVASRVKTALLALHSELKMACPELTISQVETIRQHARQICENIQDHARRLAATPDSHSAVGMGDGMDAAEDSDAKPVGDSELPAER